MRKPLHPDQEDALTQMRHVLQGDFVTLRVSRYTLDENFDAGTCHLCCHVIEEGRDSLEIEADGVGMIDAFFNALRERYAPEYPSLDSLRFTSFSVEGLMSDENARTASASDAQAEARIGVTNSYGKEFTFSAVTGSVSRSSVEVVSAAVEYFINSERAYVTMYRALEHYRSEGRTDLVARYTAGLAEMVRNTSYSAVLERMRLG